MRGFMYILRCGDNSLYVGSTTDLYLRVSQHQGGVGANYTRGRQPVELVYFEEYFRIDDAFNREKQVQGWSRKKKFALINNQPDRLLDYAKCINSTHHSNFKK